MVTFCLETLSTFIPSGSLGTFEYSSTDIRQSIHPSLLSGHRIFHVIFMLLFTFVKPLHCKVKLPLVHAFIDVSVGVDEVVVFIFAKKK